MTHKLENSNSKNVISHCEGSEPHVRHTSLGIQKKGLEIPREATLKASGFDYKTSTELGETETPILEGTNKTFHAPRLRRKE